MSKMNWQRVEKDGRDLQAEREGHPKPLLLPLSRKVWKKLRKKAKERARMLELAELAAANRVHLREFLDSQR
jgi:hypothetical protein